MWLTAKCYFVQNESGQNKYNCKGVSKKQNDLYFQCYKDVLDVFLKTRRDSELKDIDRANNVGFRVYDQGIVAYEQNKLGLLGLSAYYDKRYVLADGIHTRPLDPEQSFTTIHQRCSSNQPLKRYESLHAKCVYFVQLLLNIFFMLKIVPLPLRIFQRILRNVRLLLKENVRPIFFVSKKMCGCFS